MTPYTKRGLPRSLARDAWWLSAAPDAARGAAGPAAAKIAGTVPAVLAFVALMDWAIGYSTGGVVLTLLLAGIAAILAVALRPNRSALRDMAVIVLVFSLPVLAFVQALSVWIWVFGLLILVARALGWPLGRTAGLWIRLPWAGVAPFLKYQRQLWGESKIPGMQILRNWGLAALLGLGFVGLFTAANPVIEGAIEAVAGGVLAFDIDLGRVVFWICSAVFITLILSAAYIVPPVRNAGRAKPAPIPGIRNALWVFNLIFAVQLMTDIWVLGFSTQLPDGMTYASYAHRGAYPLILTALLAGVFMVLSRGQAMEDPVLRWLLAGWILQNIVLLIAAAYRLGLYVEVYGWTYLRLYCFIWLGLVALGLGFVCYDLWRPKGVRWIIRSSVLAAGATLYLACFINFGEVITGANLARAEEGKPTDWVYMRYLGLSNDAIVRERNAAFVDLTPRRGSYRQQVETWRDWDLRRWRRDVRIAKVNGTQWGTP